MCKRTDDYLLSLQELIFLHKQQVYHMLNYAIKSRDKVNTTVYAYNVFTIDSILYNIHLYT